MGDRKEVRGVVPSWQPNSLEPGGLEVGSADPPVEQHAPEDPPATGSSAEFWSARYGRPLTKGELFEVEANMIGLAHALLRLKNSDGGKA